jgi:hypothetical protein
MESCPKLWKVNLSETFSAEMEFRKMDPCWSSSNFFRFLVIVGFDRDKNLAGPIRQNQFSNIRGAYFMHL